MAFKMKGFPKQSTSAFKNVDPSSGDVDPSATEDRKFDPEKDLISQKIALDLNKQNLDKQKLELQKATDWQKMVNWSHRINQARQNRDYTLVDKLRENAPLMSPRSKKYGSPDMIKNFYMKYNISTRNPSPEDKKYLRMYEHKNPDGSDRYHFPVTSSKLFQDFPQQELPK